MPNYGIKAAAFTTLLSFVVNCFLIFRGTDLRFSNLISLKNIIMPTVIIVSGIFLLYKRYIIDNSLMLTSMYVFFLLAMSVIYTYKLRNVINNFK